MTHQPESEAAPTAADLLASAREEYAELAPNEQRATPWGSFSDDYVEGVLECLTDDGILTITDADAIWLDYVAIRDADPSS